MKRARSLVVGPSPYIFHRQTTASFMWGTAALLAPAVAWSVFCFGREAAFPLLCSIAAALLGEAAAGALSGRFSLRDGSAFLTGLLVGMAMPPGVPLYVPAAAALFAVVVVKGAFGGLGSNWMNPALGGIAFALLDWPRAMGTWKLPRQLAAADALSSATPLGLLRERLATAPAGSDTFTLLAAGGLHPSAFDRGVTEALNGGLFARLGADLPSGYVDLIVGNRAGSLGEISALLILAASIVLIARRMLRWEIPASILASFALLQWSFGGLPLGNGFFAGDVLFSLLTGSILLVAFFMAPDPVTSPSSSAAMIVYGSGVGLLTFLLRFFGSATEGSAFAVIIMNCFVPFLDSRILPRRGARSSRAAAAGRGA
ncbi:MAG TPA: RnfABCDGE type electron transport complex subunit D [Spirochaetales bacterium]|nr:RnfABCDGE type electron transport complex subunit D [Spirochaetales bacterium]HRY54725.1 RnfABCDGE type electron transport complex subunit D [Spirochaetia bacterium]